MSRKKTFYSSVSASKLKSLYSALVVFSCHDSGCSHLVVFRGLEVKSEGLIQNEEGIIHIDWGSALAVV